MDDAQLCAHCGREFSPRREHARFCSAACRVAWQRVRIGDPVVGPVALEWSVPGMSSAIRAVAAVDGSDRAAAFDAIGDAVWAVTIVDAALVRYHPGAYDNLLAAEAPTGRQLIEQVLGGLRFVRNQIAGNAEVASLVEPTADDPVERGAVLNWTWKAVSEPEVTAPESRTHSWEAARYQAYRAGVAGHSVAATFARAETFLLRAAAGEALITDAARPRYIR